MQWGAFVVFNSAGAVVWAALYRFTAFYFTNQVKRLSGPVGTAVGILAAVVVVAAAIWAHFHRDELEKKAAEAVLALGLWVATFRRKIAGFELGATAERAKT